MQPELIKDKLLMQLINRKETMVEFVVSSRPCSEGFSPGSPVFLPPQKLTFLNSNEIWKVSPISTRVLDPLTLK